MASEPVTTGRRAQRGFVLAVTLWVLAGITIIVGLMTLWAVTRVQDAQREHARLTDEASLYDTRDTLLYLIATRSRTFAGQPTSPPSAAELAAARLSEFGRLPTAVVGNELRLDSTPYHGLGSSEFALQDGAGLFPMVWPRPDQLDRFLALHGIPADRWPRLTDTLLDYIDPDDLTRVNGAESREYIAKHLPPPPNRRLVVPAELARVMSWDTLPPATLTAIIGQITTYYSGAMNPNTMPPALLPMIIPGCPETCQRLVQARKQQPFSSTLNLETRLGVRLFGDGALDYRYVASDVLRITLWRRTGVAWRLHVELTPLADHAAPWRIIAAYPVSRPLIDEPVEPTRSAFFADAPAVR